MIYLFEQENFRGRGVTVKFIISAGGTKGALKVAEDFIKLMNDDTYVEDFKAGAYTFYQVKDNLSGIIDTSVIYCGR